MVVMTVVVMMSARDAGLQLDGMRLRARNQREAMGSHATASGQANFLGDVAVMIQSCGRGAAP